MMRGQCGGICVLHDAHLFLFFALLLLGSSGVSAFTITRTVRVPGDCSGAAWEALDPELVVSQHQIRPVSGESLSYTVPVMASKCRVLLVGGGGAGGSYTGEGSRGGGSGEIIMLEVNVTPGEDLDFVVTPPGGIFSFSKTPFDADPLDGDTITFAGVTANGGNGGRKTAGGGNGFSGGGGTGLKSPSPAYNQQLRGGYGGLNGLNGGVLSGGVGVGSTAEVLTCEDEFFPPRPPSFNPVADLSSSLGGSAQCPILAGRYCGGSGAGGIRLTGFSYYSGGSTYDSALNTLGWGPGSPFNYGGQGAGGGGGGGSYDTTLARTSQGGYGAPPQAFVQCFRDPAFNLCDATVPAGHTKVSSQLFTANGTFTAPAGASDMKLRVLAMGGGGGAGASYNIPGAYSGWLKSAVINNVSPGQQFPVTVGQGGASCINVCGGGAPNYHAGNPGGSSSFGSFVAEGGHAVTYSGQEHKRAMGTTAGGTGSTYRWNFQSTGPQTGPGFYAGNGGSNGGNGGLGTYNQNTQILPGHGPFDACLSSFTDHVFTPGPGGKGADVSEPLVMPDNTQGQTYLLAGGGGAGGVLIDGQGPVAGNGNNGGGSIKGKYYNISGSGGVGYGAGGGAGGYGCETNPSQIPFSNAAGGAGAPGFVFVEVYIPTLATTAAAPATTTAGPATTTAGPATTTAVPATTTDVPGSSASTDGSVAKDEAAGSSSGFGIDWIIIAAAAGACCCCILIIVAVAVIRKRRSKERDDLDLDPGSVPMSAVGSIGPSGFSTPLSPDEHYQAISGNVTPHKTIGTTGYDAYEHSHAGSVSSPPAQKGSHASRILARNLSSKSLIDHKELQFGGQLGEGSYGVVYRGTWRNQEVAVKMVKNDAGVTDASQISEALIDEFAEESELMANLRPHTNVCLLLGITVEPNLCIVTELYPNGCVYDYCEKHGRFSRADVYNILKGVAGGLSHLHSEGVVHRDLAARNILLAQGLVPKIADFGMSRVLDQGEGSAGQTKSNTGPLKWMAPECLVHHEYSTKSDVWAYGVCMFEVTTAQDPYPGEAPIRVATLVSHNELQLRLPDELLAEYDSVQQAMAWCMAFLANDRPDMNTVFGHMSSLS